MRKRWAYAWKSVAAVVVVLVLGEFLVRTLALSHRRNFQITADLGSVQAAGSTVRWGSEGWGITHFVADGEIATPYSGGPVVIVLGDSHTEALQVNDDVKFVSAAETLLHSRGVPADLRNFGRSGTSMADYVWLTPVMRRRFQPAAIVIEIDEYDFDFHAFDPRALNHFVVRSAETIELIHASSAAAQGGPLPLVTRLFTGLAQVSTLLEYAQYRFNLPRNRAADAAVAQLPGLDPVLSVRLQAELLREAAEDTPVILLRLPYSPYPSANGNPIFTALRHALPWPFLDPAEALQKSREQGRDPRTFYNTPLGGGHLNATGHAIVARMLADELEKLLR